MWIPLCLTNWFKKNIMIEVGQDEYFLARAQWFEGKKLLSFRSIELVKICSLEYNFFVAWKHFEGFELSIGWATKKDWLWSHQSLGHKEEKNFSFYLDDTKGWIKKLHPFRKDKQKLLAFGMASGLFCMTFSRSLLSSPILIIVEVFPPFKRYSFELDLNTNKECGKQHLHRSSSTISTYLYLIE